LVYKDQPVITSKVLAALYETEPGNIRENFRHQKARFTEGKHFFKVKGNEFAALRECVRSSDVLHALPKGGRELTLWTARGAARHAKMLDTDKAWEVFELLEDCYFKHAEKPAPVALPATSISPEEQRHIQNLIEAKVGNGPNRRQLFAQAWNRLKNKFRVPRYEEITPEQYPDVIEYLLKMELRQPLPAPEPKASTPTPVQEEADLAGAITAHRQTWVPKLDEVEKLTWQAQGSVNRIMSVVCQLAHKTDGNEVAILGNLSQAASDMLRHRGESINAAIGELLSLAAMTFSAIASNLELKNTRKTLRDIRKALPA
jgi:hypothetical protein